MINVANNYYQGTFLASAAPVRPSAPLWADEEELDELIDACLITPRGLDRCPPPSPVACANEHAAVVRAFVAATPAFAPFRGLVERRKVIERALVVANEALGGTRGLAEHERSAYREAHLAFVLEMLWMWVLDETLDGSPREAARSGDTLRRIAARIARAHDGAPPAVRPPVVHAAAGQGELVACVSSTLDRYERTSPLHRPSGALFCRAMERYLRSQRAVHHRFASWAAYEEHRAYNSGLWSTTLHAAAFLRHRSGVEHAGLCRLSARHMALVQRYCIIGALANDLFGLRKDLEEGVATSVSVLRAQLERQGGEAEVVQGLVRYHNERLQELAGELRATSDPLAQLLLYAALRAAWSVRRLHEDHRDVYDPAALRAYLGPQRTSTARVT